MKCIVLAAGYATRLYPLTENFPKPLLKVENKTILDWLLDDIDSMEQINEFVIISNHKFVEYFEDWSKNQRYSTKVTVIDDGSISNDTRLGAVKDIQFALESLNIDEDCLVIAGDNLLDFPLSSFVQFALEKDRSCVMCHEEHDLKKQQKTAIIVKNENDLIVSYEEKPKQPKGNLAVPPFYFYKRKDLHRIAEAIEQGCGTDAPGSFAAWLSFKTKMYAFLMPGKRYDIGDLSSYEYVQDVFSGKNRE